MNKKEITEKRNKLCEILAKIANLNLAAKPLREALAGDFTEHEQEYREGIKTPSGLLVRKPKWELHVKPSVKVED